MGKIIIDCQYDEDGIPTNFQYLDDELPETAQLLKDLNDDKSKHEAAGYAVVSSLPGLPDGTSRWQTIVNHTSKVNAPEELKSLSLK